jgi:hypothetical protein
VPRFRVDRLPALGCQSADALGASGLLEEGKQPGIRAEPSKSQLQPLGRIRDGPIFLARCRRIHEFPQNIEISRTGRGVITIPAMREPPCPSLPLVRWNQFQDP